MHWFNVMQPVQSVIFTPGRKLNRCSSAGLAGIWVADVSGEKLNKSLTCFEGGCKDNRQFCRSEKNDNVLYHS